MGRILSVALILAFSPIIMTSTATATEQESKKKEKECEEAEKEAQKMCNDSAPAAQQAQQQQNQQAQNKGGSTQGNCANRMDALKPLLGMLGQLQGGCQQAQADCQQKCGKAKQSPGTDCNDEPNNPSCKGTAQKTGGTGQEKGNKCQQLDKNLAKIGEKIAEAMANLAAAQKCEEQTNKDCKDPKFAQENPQQCKPPFNCNVPESFAGDAEKTRQCRCQQNPRGEGCEGYEASTAALTEAAKRRDSETNLPTPDGKTTTPSSASASTNSSAPPVGGGFGGGGGGGSSGSGDKGGGSARDGVAGKKDLIQVNSGEYGGGGGGAKRASGGGYGDPSDPARGPAGRKILSRNEQQMVKGVPTGAHGRSNWQKIHDRYRDNHPSFTP